MWEWVIIGGIIVAIVLISRMASSGGGVSKAVRRGDVSAMAEHILEKKDDDSRATVLDRTVKELWDSYRRDLAAQLIKRVAPSAAGVAIVQYWIRQVLEVEPDIARERFDPEFLADCFNPELAMRCGKTG